MSRFNFITAIGTPLTEDDQLHRAGLEAQIEDQHSAGIDGMLVAGTMGLLQLLSDETYQQLVEESIALTRGRMEVLVGAGDASFARTAQRIEYLNGLKGIDGIVLLSPYFIAFSQAEMIDYFTALADVAERPIYMYDLPVRCHVALDYETVATLSKHPNIAGIKCSGDVVGARRLYDEVRREDFRVIIAQPLIMDLLLRVGIAEHLDGIYAVFPQWITAMGRAAEKGDWQEVTRLQHQVATVLNELRHRSVYGVFTALMNARGIPGRYAPRPMRMLSEAQTQETLSTPAVKTMLQDLPILQA